MPSLPFKVGMSLLLIKTCCFLISTCCRRARFIHKSYQRCGEMNSAQARESNCSFYCLLYFLINLKCVIQLFKLQVRFIKLWRMWKLTIFQFKSRLILNITATMTFEREMTALFRFIMHASEKLITVRMQSSQFAEDFISDYATLRVIYIRLPLTYFLSILSMTLRKIAWMCRGFCWGWTKVFIEF